MKTRLTVVFCLTLLAACGMDAADSAGAPRADAAVGTQCFGANDCPPGQMCNEFGYCSPLASLAADGGVPDPDADGSLPPEVEQKQSPPASGKQYVYVAVPAQNMVAKIHSQTLAVRSIKVGKDPVSLRTVAGQDVALVLARQSATASVLRSRADGGDDVVTLPTASGLNQLAVAPGGKHAVAYFDVARSGGNIAANQALQEVTVLHLTAGSEKSINFSVGFRPQAVHYSSDGQKAFVITEQGVSIIELSTATKPGIAPTVPLLKDPLAEATLEEVLVTSDGKYALGRRAGIGGIRVVDLTSSVISDLALGGDATDLDLTDDGTLAVAVLRDSQQVALIDIPDDLGPSAQIDTLPTGPYTAGQAVLSKDGKRAFLFTNATSQEVLLVAGLVGTRQITVHPLQKGVRTVHGSPDGSVALVVHNKVVGTPSATDTFETFVDKSFGYSLLKVGSGYDKLLLTSTDPGEVAFAPSSAAAYLLLGNSPSGTGSTEAIDLETFLVESVPLGSPPAALGVIASTQMVYVAQSHPLGRITFISMASNKTKTVTGFELNSHIIE